jgi:uroporphyrinogen decarboxylase
MNNIFENRRQTNGKTHVPVWFMRQAGRYHAHYQAIKAKSDFISMCKTPQLACDVTMGPIEDFKFDAAILFSDLLFPLEHLGTGLRYDPGPKLDWHLDTVAKLNSLKELAPAEQFFKFQKDACILLKKALPADRTLLGFVGGPFTLYTYVTEGLHDGNLVSAKQGLHDGRWDGFLERLLPNLITEMRVQAEGGADAVCLFDTAAGELSPGDYARFVVPALKHVMTEFKKLCPQTRITYYSKHTQRAHLEALHGLPIDTIGIDWRCDLVETQKMFPGKYVQGNFDPVWLHLPQNILIENLRSWHKDLVKRGLDQSKWICGLGHGVTIQTPESNVRKVVELVHSEFTY